MVRTTPSLRLDGRLNIDADRRVHLQVRQCEILCRGGLDNAEQVRLSALREGAVLPLSVLQSSAVRELGGQLNVVLMLASGVHLRAGW